MCDLGGQIGGQILKIHEILYKISFRELQRMCLKYRWHTLLFQYTFPYVDKIALDHSCYFCAIHMSTCMKINVNLPSPKKFYYDFLFFNHWYTNRYSIGNYARSKIPYAIYFSSILTLTKIKIPFELPWVLACT